MLIPVWKPFNLWTSFDLCGISFEIVAINFQPIYDYFQTITFPNWFSIRFKLVTATKANDKSIHKTHIMMIFSFSLLFIFIQHMNRLDCIEMQAFPAV